MNLYDVKISHFLQKVQNFYFFTSFDGIYKILEVFVSSILQDYLIEIKNTMYGFFNIKEYFTVLNITEEPSV